jgi:ectoine hydroxylase-related dioxygenase (phytanoyl-CoA dioxygenase family)
MQMPPALSPGQLATFEQDGLLRLPGLIAAEAARSACEPIRHRLSELLQAGPKPEWPAGLTPAGDFGRARLPAEALFQTPAVKTLIEAALGARAADHTAYRRPQILVSLPNRGAWTLPRGWHTDIPRLASGARPGVQLFVLLDHVASRGGATLVVAGSHRLLNDAGPLKLKQIKHRLGVEPFFRRLYAGQDGSDLPSGVAAGVPVRVVELAGQAGDAWLIDLRLLHAASPNATDRPRMMATHRYIRADLMPEVAAASGWR